MKWVLKAKWPVLILWLVGAFGLFFAAPNMEDLVRDKGQITVPDGYPSQIASQLIAEAQGDEGSSDSVALVYYRESGLSEGDIAEAERSISLLQDRQEELGIKSVLTHFDQADLAEQLVAEDGSTILVSLQVDLQNLTPKEFREKLHQTLEDVKVEHYVTSSWLIEEDVLISSQEGLKRTEIITVGFILLILLLVFRSPVAPIIPLATIGLSYVAAQSIVAFLIDQFNFPVSTFTQIFMVAVMFGIGTDYCILLISRYKEELVRLGNKAEAVLETYRTAGKTVLFAGLAVLVGFTSIGFSTFVLYRSAVAVAVGVAVLMIALFTAIPVLLLLLGKGLFWPVKGTLQHSENKLWHAAGRFSLRRPLITLVLIGVIVAPFLLTYQGVLSFNSMEEIGEKYDSVKAFNIIADSFGPGESMPSTVVVKHRDPLDTLEGMALIEKVSREIAGVEGVKTVRSATRPVGEVLEDFLVPNQMELLVDGLDQGKDGLVQIRDGLAEAGASLAESAPEIDLAVSSVGQLVQGAEELRGGIAALGDGISRIEVGLRDGSIGARELSQGLAQAKSSAEQLAAANKELLQGYQEMGGGLSTISSHYKALEESLSQLSQGLEGMELLLGGLAQKYPELQTDPDFLKAQGMSAEFKAGTDEIAAGFGQLNEQLAQLSAGLSQANQGLAQAFAGQEQLTVGLDALLDGMEQLEAGISQAAAGQGQISSSVPDVLAGMDQLNSGQKQMQAGFGGFKEQLQLLTDGLDQSVDGLTQVSDGIAAAQVYLGEISESSGPLAGWHLPEEALHNEEFQQVFDVYLSADRRTTTFDIVLEDHPYSMDSFEDVANIQAAVDRAVQGTALEHAEVAIGGVSSIYSDLHTISQADYSRTVVLMLIGIALILIVLLRSLVMPIYLIASLILTYYTSIAFTELIFVKLLGYTGITWAVPFFSFVILVALGIDYSIFLMDRFNEYKHMDVQEAILSAMKNMGTVIISAVVILGGTFAAMLPSGVLSLLQIATTVLTGLVLYALLFLPLFVPVMVKLFGRANYWPFMQQKDAK